MRKNNIKESRSKRNRQVKMKGSSIVEGFVYIHNICRAFNFI